MTDTRSLLHTLSEEILLGDECRLKELIEDIYQSALTTFQNNENQLTEDTALSALKILNTREGMQDGKGTFNRLLANVYNREGSFRKSFETNLIAADQFIKAGNINLASTVYSNCGALLYYLGDKSGAYKKQLLALQLADEHNLKYEKAKALLNIAIILQGRREFIEAMKLMKQAEALFREETNDWGIAYSFAAIASLKKRMGKPQESYDYHLKALDIRSNMKDEKGIILALINIASALLSLDRFVEAEQNCIKAHGIIVSNNWPFLKAQVLVNHAEAVLKQDRNREALEIINETELLFSTFEGLVESRIQLVYLKALAKHNLGEHEEAFLILIEHNKMKKEVLEESKDEEISRMRIATEVETSLREKEVIAQKNEQLSAANTELRDALAQIKTLSGMLPICGSCKRIRDDDGYWQQLESYISKNSDAQFSHGLCNECMKKLYPELENELEVEHKE